MTTPPEPGDFLADPASFGRRLKRIQTIRDPYEKARKLERLLEMFGAQVVCCGVTVAGYRLPNGDWFCRKMTYATLEQAETELRRTRNRRGLTHRSAYQCPTCSKWHMTHRLKNLSPKC